LTISLPILALVRDKAPSRTPHSARDTTLDLFTRLRLPTHIVTYAQWYRLRLLVPFFIEAVPSGMRSRERLFDKRVSVFLRDVW